MLADAGSRRMRIDEIREALQELEKDHEFLLQGDVFTRDQLEGYMALKWEEVYAFEHTPHPVEYKMYSSC